MDHLTLRIDPDTRDITLDDAGDLRMISGADSIAQAVRLTLQVYRGEWFLDDRHGVDYPRIVGLRPTDAEVIQTIREAIFQEPEVAHIDALTVSRDDRARTLTVNFRARLRDGQTIATEVSA